MNTTATFSSDHSWLTSSRRNSIESVLSIQGKETDFVRDTSDTESLSDGVEYEPVTEPDDDDLFSDDSTGESDKDVIKTQVIEVTVLDEGDLELADSEQTDSDGMDSEMDLHDYWQCALCLAENNNPLYRYCEKCYKVRKNIFPPRPKRKGKRKTRTDTEDTHTRIHSHTHVQALVEHTDSGVDSAFASQDLSQNTASPSDSDMVNSQTENDKSNIPGHSRDDLIKRTFVKRRAESADRNRKRPIDSDSDSCSDVEAKRKRKSKSLEKDVAPLTKTISDPALTIDVVDSKGADNDNLCIMCLTEPKSGVFVHGRIAHICCCYKCAVKVWTKSKRCPVCNSKVSNVLKAVIM